jgi:DNA-binding beta-propeller fold protein YncE
VQHQAAARREFSRRTLLVAGAALLAACAAPAATASPPATRATPVAVATVVVSAAAVAGTPAVAAHPLLLVANATGRHLSIVDPVGGVVERIEVGAAPWGIALGPDGRAYVSTAEGLAVLEAGGRRRRALVRYQSQEQIDPSRTGEYRPGGMGVAVSPDGRRVYVAVYVGGGPSRLEVFDAERSTWIGSVPVGVRPFDVLVSRDGRQAYSIDHDSYSVTVVDAATLATRSLEVAPVGRGAFDKPHYAALAPDGRLILPVQGRALALLDPASGALEQIPLTAETHQHGLALAPDGRTLLIVGTGPAGGAARAPSLTMLDLASRAETVVPLGRAHERVAVSPGGRFAYLTGGYLLGGWDGITVVDLQQRTTKEIAVPDRPLDVRLLPPEPSPEASRALIAAAETGDADRVRQLLAQGASVHAADAGGRTALIAAAYAKRNEAARLLIAAGADVNRQDDTRQSAYLIPTADGNLELLRMTLAAGADVHSLDSYSGTGLIRAADRGHVEVIGELLTTPIKVDHVNRLGWTALLEAIILGDGGSRHAECVRLLLAAGASPNLADGAGVTPLQHARRKGHLEMARLIEAAGGR